MMPSLSAQDQQLTTHVPVKLATGDQRLSPELSNPKIDPPPEKRTAAPVASRSGAKKINKKADAKAYTPIALLDKWRLQQMIFADRILSPTAKVVAGVLLACVNCKSGKCCPSLAYLAARIGKKRGVVAAAIKQLRHRGWITRRRRRGSSVYHFAFDRLQQRDVQETASHENEDVQDSAHLEMQDLAHEQALKAAHLNTGKIESGNRNQELVHASETPIVRAARGKQKKPRSRQTPLAENWQPSQRDVELAIQRGLSEEAIPREIEKFKNHHIAKGTTMLDWNRAWQNWCIRAVEYANARRITNVHSNRSLVAGLLSTDGPNQWGRS